jgi:hypothetical protein
MTVNTNANKKFNLDYKYDSVGQIINKNGWKDFFTIAKDKKFCAIISCTIKDKSCAGKYTGVIGKKIDGKSVKAKIYSKIGLQAPF